MKLIFSTDLLFSMWRNNFNRLNYLLPLERPFYIFAKKFKFRITTISTLVVFTQNVLNYVYMFLENKNNNIPSIAINDCPHNFEHFETVDLLLTVTTLSPQLKSL